MNNELNKKLAEWAGFWDWTDPEGYNEAQEPSFTESLDACFKWLVTKLQDKGHQIELLAFEHKGFRATIYETCFSQRGSESQQDNEAPALALCLAVEKLIDGE